MGRVADRVRKWRDFRCVGRRGRAVAYVSRQKGKHPPKDSEVGGMVETSVFPIKAMRSLIDRNEFMLHVTRG